MNDIIPIDAKALIQELNGMCIDDYNIYCDVFNMIENAEVLDYAHVIHAHWEYCCRFRHTDYYRCSHPRRAYDIHDNTKYCQHCGAIMDEEV